MKKFAFLLLIVFVSFNVQSQTTKLNPEVYQGVLVKITPPLSEFTPPADWVDEIVRDEYGVIGENKDNIENRVKHPNAILQPKGKDPVIQDYFGERKKRITTLIQNYQGHGNTGVSPADPTLCVGPNHVIQMINGSSGARLTIYDKLGNTIVAAQYMDAITGVPGLGDPVALYDQLADRFVLTEFSSSGNKLVIMVSQTANPTGSWYIYQFTAPEFPDYPKYGIWNNAFICTSNESNNKVYAFDRPTMIVGGVTATMIAFTIPFSPSLSFQAAAPVNISGTIQPPVGTLPLVMRMTDDGWGGGLNDALEMWEMNLDFITPGLSSLTQLPSLNTAPFTTDLCGYVTLNCIRQPGATRLDPIREIIMNRVWYRNFNTHQSIVLCHSVDATGLDQAGVRWYELRRTGLGPWSIYQQSTYAPDTNSRWMGTIGINAQGSIGLVYNVSSKNVFPSLRFTGRKPSDPLNTMPEMEQTIIAGAANHTNNRWGDYNDMQVDPSDDFTYWTTGMYMPAGGPWTTRVASFNILDAPLPVSILSFDGKKINEKTNQLNWVVDNESISSKYFLERAVSGTSSFVTIATVDAKADKTVQKYQYNDQNFTIHESYEYRLRIEDIDQNIRYSNTVYIKGTSPKDITMYPNPNNGNEVYFRFLPIYDNQKVKITITDINGKLLQAFEKSENNKSQIIFVQLNNIPNGIYIVKCYNDKGETIHNEKLTKY